MYTWQQIINALWAADLGSLVRIETWQIEHPTSVVGMVPVVNLPLGQQATYMLQFTNGETLLVSDFGGHYEARRQSAWLPMPVSIPPAWPLPQMAPAAPATLEQALSDSPGTTLLATTALGALFGAMSGTKNGTLTGAMLGGAVGLAAVSAATASKDPATSERTKELLEALAKVASSTNGPSHSTRALTTNAARREPKQLTTGSEDERTTTKRSGVRKLSTASRTSKKR